VRQSAPGSLAAAADLDVTVSARATPRRLPGSLRYLGSLALVCLAYVLAGAAALALSAATKPVPIIWLPTGVALTALLALGNRLWPGIALGAVLASVLAGEPLLAAGYLALGNTVTALVGAILLRALGFDAALLRARDVVSLFTVAVMSTLISATIGSTALLAVGLVAGATFPAVWSDWWTGDGLGILITAPLLLTWIADARTRSVAGVWEYSAFLTATALVSLAVFVLPISESPVFYPRAYVAFPLLAWAGLRLGPRATAQGLAIIAILAIWGTFHGHGPFSRRPPDSRLVLLGAYLATVGCTALLIAAIGGERQGARLAARESEGLLKAIISHTPAVIFVKDLQGRYIMVNRRYEALWGLPESVVRGKTDFDMFPAEEAERFRAMDERVVRSGHALTEEEVAQRPDGRHTYVSVKFPLHNEAGGVFAIVGISTDVTELNRAQAQLRQAYEELEIRIQQRTAELAGAVTELGQRNREKETLLREIHHRVKNNLQVVSSLLNLRAQGSEEPGLAAFAAECRARVRSMALVHEHLYQSRNLNSVPLGKYVRELVNETVHAQQTSGAVRVEVRIPPEIALPIDQAIPCGLIVNELVTNALKHAFPAARSGTVTVGVGVAADGQIELAVSDDGVGIRDAVAPDGDAEDSSFGFTLVSMLVEQLHGTQDLVTRPGTRVSVRFPPRTESPPAA
jgi:PAS domain S-box-containing protein